MQATQFDFRRLAAIYAGGVLGALARVGLAQAMPHGPDSWPWGTFVVNMAAPCCSATSSPGCATIPRTASPTRSSPPGSAGP